MIKVKFVVLLVVLLSSIVSANSCNAVQMGEMIKRGLSAKDIDKICEIEKKAVKSEIKKDNVLESIKKDNTKHTEANSASSNVKVFVGYESQDVEKDKLSGFSTGADYKGKNFVVDAMYSTLDESKINILNLKYEYQFKLSNKISLAPEVIFNRVSGDVRTDINQIMLGANAKWKYRKNGHLKLSLVLAGTNEKYHHPAIVGLSSLSLPATMTIESKEIFNNNIVIHTAFRILNSTRERRDYTYDLTYDSRAKISSLELGAEYIVNKHLSVKASYRSTTLAEDLESDNITKTLFGVGYKF